MKRYSTPLIALVAVLVFAVAAGFLVLAGSGDNTPVQGIGNTPVANTPVARNTPAPGEFGDPPRLGDNVEAISPAHAQTVSQSSTVPPAGVVQPGGVCATVNFENFGASPETLRWFHMAFDGELVTQLTTVFPTATNSDTGVPDGAVICYMPDEGLPVGMHTVAVSVSDPNVPAAPARQLVGWSFEVAP